MLCARKPGNSLPQVYFQRRKNITPFRNIEGARNKTVVGRDIENLFPKMGSQPVCASSPFVGLLSEMVRNNGQVGDVKMPLVFVHLLNDPASSI